MPSSSWLRFAQRYDGVSRGLDLLDSAAAVSLGGQPLTGVTVTNANSTTTLSVPWMDGVASVDLHGP